MNKNKARNRALWCRGHVCVSGRLSADDDDDGLREILMKRRTHEYDDFSISKKRENAIMRKILNINMLITYTLDGLIPTY